MSNHRESNIKLGTNRDKPRIWIEGQWLERFGFAPGREIGIRYDKNRVDILLAETGAGDDTPKGGLRIVSSRGKSRPGGIIDINSKELEEIFASGITLHVVAGPGRITITPAKTLLKKAARTLTKVAVGLFVGGGLLDAAIHNCGFNTEAAVEVNPAFAEVWESNHSGNMYEQAIEEVDFAAIAGNLDQPVGLLAAGRPCECFSNIRTLDRGGQTKRNKTLPPEAHPLGHLDYFMLSAVDHLNPHTVVIENVPGYLDAGAGYMVKGVLKSMGYLVESRVLNSIDFGSLQARKRGIIVATTFDVIHWPNTVPHGTTFGKIMDHIPDDSPLWWGTEHWAAKHWAKQSAKGNGFAAPAITADSTQVPTLKKRYYAGQGDNFVVAHPTKPDTWRWLTLDEGRRLMGIPTEYDLGPSKTTAGEVLGQGCVVPLFEKLIASITNPTGSPSVVQVLEAA